MDYSDRRITTVTIEHMRRVIMNANDAPGLFGQVEITLSNHKGDDNGPKVIIQLASRLPSAEATLADCEKALLDAATRRSSACSR